MKQIKLLLVLVGIVFLSVSLANAGKRINNGIHPLGKSGQGVLLCGEAITINIGPGISIIDTFDMFDQAIFLMEEGCAK